MKFFILSSLFTLLSLQALAGTTQSTALTECKDQRGSVIPNSIDQLKTTMKSNAGRPQVFATGVVTEILPEDHNGLPHQKYTISVAGQFKLLIVSNLDFGRVPVAVGTTVSVCGEFKKVGSGMIHWTHFDPHGGHPDGFTIVNGKLYGDTETPGFNE